jgi:hypothetical protein
VFAAAGAGVVPADLGGVVAAGGGAACGVAEQAVRRVRKPTEEASPRRADRRVSSNIRLSYMIGARREHRRDDHGA